MQASKSITTTKVVKKLNYHDRLLDLHSEMLSGLQLDIDTLRRDITFLINRAAAQESSTAQLQRTLHEHKQKLDLLSSEVSDQGNKFIDVDAAYTKLNDWVEKIYKEVMSNKRKKTTPKAREQTFS